MAVILIRGADKRESGNVLFLILIAVALFAALSYAVTQSSRTGGSDASRETMLTNISALMQFPASLRLAVTRMTLDKGITGGDIDFTSPEGFSVMTPNLLKLNIYHPTGGGAVYSKIPANMQLSGIAGDWLINSDNEVFNIGTDSAPGPNEALNTELIAFAPGMKQDICLEINRRLGITGIPVETSVDAFNPQGSGGYMSNGGGGKIGSALGDPLKGQSQGCFNNGGDFTYYAVLQER